jgi:ComF family protein
MLPGLREFIRLIYPSSCMACGNSLNQAEKDVCLSCLLALPRTRFHEGSFNPLNSLLKGRVAVNGIYSCYFFDKGSGVQKLLHSIKYKGKRELAVTLGEWYGHELQPALPQPVDCIVPVPLHSSRQAVRGYNQSEAFGEGLAKAMNIPVDGKNLYRRSASATQTRKSRIERWENVDTIFSTHDPAFFRDKSVLLVDDVITTGATLEACAQVLQRLDVRSLQIATIACAVKI